MKYDNSIIRKISFFIASVSTLLLASCGSYQYSGIANDGIYGDSYSSYPERNQYVTQESNSSYYKNKFAEESALYGEVLAEDAIFTDVESYSSTGEYETEGEYQPTYRDGNAPWGQDPDSYSINIINTGFYGGFGRFWGPGFGYDPFWGPGFGFDPFWGSPYWGRGFYGPGFWGHPYAIGYGGFYPGFGFGFGYGLHPYAYGIGGFYNPYLYHGPVFQRNVAYNTGRRNASTSYRGANSSAVRNATMLDSRGRSSSYSRSIRNLRNSNDDYGITRRSSNSRVNRSDYYQRRGSNMNSSTRSSEVYSRRSAPASRNMGSMRSSGATRSSGSVRSSGGGRSSGSRGRGNNL